MRRSKRTPKTSAAHTTGRSHGVLIRRSSRALPTAPSAAPTQYVVRRTAPGGDKTPPVFLVLVFLIVCTVGSLLTAMVHNKPLVSALAIALMSAPLAATGAAAVLHGLYFCDRVSRCLVGLIPY